MKKQNVVIDQTGKILKRTIREDERGKYVLHLGMRAAIEIDRVITGDLVETTMYAVMHYNRVTPQTQGEL